MSVKFATLHPRFPRMRSRGRVKCLNSLIFSFMFTFSYHKNAYLQCLSVDVLVVTCYDRRVKMSRSPDNVNNEEETFRAPYASRSARTRVDMRDR